MPAGGQRAGLGLAVADHRRRDQVRIVRDGPEGVGQGVAQLASLVDGSRSLRRVMTGDATGEGKLLEQSAHPPEILGHLRINLAIRSFQVGVRHYPGAAVSWSAHEDDIEVPGADDPVEMGVNKVETGRRAPVTEQSRLDLSRGQGLGQ